MNRALIINQPFILNTKLSLRRKTNFKVFWFFIVILIIFLLVFYVFQVNSEAYKRYLIKKYQTEISEISRENQELEVASLQLNSLEKITSLVENLNFKKTEKIHYIKVLDGKIVTK